MNSILTVQEAARIAKVSRRTIYNWIDKGKIVVWMCSRRYIVIGRSLEKYLKERR